VITMTCPGGRTDLKCTSSYRAAGTSAVRRSVFTASAPCTITTSASGATIAAHAGLRQTKYTRGIIPGTYAISARRRRTSGRRSGDENAGRQRYGVLARERITAPMINTATSAWTIRASAWRPSVGRRLGSVTGSCLASLRDDRAFRLFS